jgi:hypothetical protein
MQEDTLIGDLSVRSNLYYSALLRLPRSMALKEKKKKVEGISPAPLLVCSLQTGYQLTLDLAHTNDLLSHCVYRWSK